MKTQFLLIIALLTGAVTYAQDSVRVEKIKAKLVTFTPNAKLENTNGINLGVADDYKTQRINGINLQGNPYSLLYPLLPRAIEVPDESEATVTINGLHISTGGVANAKKLNGIGISMYHIARVTNGVTLNGFNNNSHILNGIHVSLFNNSAQASRGLLVSLSNSVEDFKGIQLGMYNNTKAIKGLQIGIANVTRQNKGVQLGLFNKTEKNKGLQIGFWNKNGKRTLPVINF